VAAAGLGALAALTTLGPWSRSMVAPRGDEVSNMFPTSACIAAPLAAFQLGLILLAHPALARWLARRRAARPLWIIGPAIVLVGLLSVVSPARRDRSRVGH
jgi:hypothetical protein